MLSAAVDSELPAEGMIKSGHEGMLPPTSTCGISHPPWCHKLSPGKGEGEGKRERQTQTHTHTDTHTNTHTQVNQHKNLLARFLYETDLAKIK